MKTPMPSAGAMRLALLSLIVAVVNPAGAQAPNGTVTIVATDQWAAEAWSDPGVFTVRRSEPSTFPTRVFYQISGTASNGVDYEALANSIEIPPLTLGVSFTVKPINDSLIESTESVLVRIIPSPMLCPTCGYIIGDRDVAEVLIEDNDRGSTNRPPFVRLDWPPDGATYATPANVVLRAYAQDYEDRFLVKVEFFEGANSLGFGTFRATLCPAPYCPYFDLIWSNVPPGEYSVTTRATDSAGATSISDTARITVLDTTNHPPSVRVAVPDPGATFITPAEIMLVADAVDQEDGKQIHVEFFEGTNSLGLATFNPTRCAYIWCGNFSLVWSNVPPGSHYLRARATDSQGATTVSAPVQINVFGGVNIYATDPNATEWSAMTAIPPDTATFTVRRSGDTSEGIVVFYEISGTASNGVDYRTLSGHVGLPAGASSAEIVVDPLDDILHEPTETVSLRLQATCPQCLFTWPPCLPPVSTNCYAIGPDHTAVAYIRDTDPPTETNHPPFVELIAPREGETFVAPADIRLVAFAQDREDNYHLQVEFFEGTRSLGFGTFNPTRCWPGCPNYILVWSNAPVGQYTLTARATDSGGASSISQPVHITVSETSPPPVVNIVARDPFASEGQHFWRDYPEANSWSGDYWNTWGVNIGRTNTATFIVRRHTAGSAALTVNYEIAGTASNGTDCRALSGSVQIPAGKRSARVVVVPTDDALTEGTETVVLRLSPSSNYTIGAPSQAAAIIVDNDMPRPQCVLLPDRRFHLCLLATNGLCFRLEGSPDLRNWTPLCTNIVTDGALHFVDPEHATNLRFYRVRPDSAVPFDD